MKYVFIENHRAEFSVKNLCRVLQVARSGWYAWRLRRQQIAPRQQFRLVCDTAVRKAFTEAKQRYGAPRLAGELPEYNVNTIAASLRRQGVRAKAARKFSPVSYREHGLPVSENLLKHLHGSMSAKGCCYDNACEESFFHSLKVECIHGERFISREIMRTTVFNYIECDYNRWRRHSACGGLSPQQFENQNLA
ncbi:IS3 element transposase [Rahnella bruchi]